MNNLHSARGHLRMQAAAGFPPSPRLLEAVAQVSELSMLYAVLDATFSNHTAQVALKKCPILPKANFA